MRFWIRCLILLLLPIPSFSAERHAIVIGVDVYDKYPRLDSPVKDAKRMAKALSDLGYKVYKPDTVSQALVDPGADDFEFHFNNFLTDVQNGSEVVFYFSGHGIGANGDNHLLLRDSKVGSKRELSVYPDGIVSVRKLLDQLKRKNFAGVNVLFLDACRNVPEYEDIGKIVQTEGSRQGIIVDGEELKGSAPIQFNEASGSFIGYAADFGREAWEDVNAGHFTDALVSELESASVNEPIEDMFKLVVDNVLDETDDKQRPMPEPRIKGKYCINGCIEVPSPTSSGFCFSLACRVVVGVVAVGLVAVLVDDDGDSDPQVAGGVAITLPVP